MKRNSKFKKLSCLLLIFMLCLSLVQTEWVYADEVRYEHAYPKTVKVGEIISSGEYVVNVYGLEPNTEYDGGLYHSEVRYLGGVASGGEVQTTDANGNLLNMFDYDVMAYKAGDIQVGLVLENYDYDFSEVYEVCSVKVETPIITHNAPERVKVGDIINFTTTITNTAYKDRKISDYSGNKYFLETFYVPSVQIIEGANLVSQSEQDYTNTLKTAEKLTFTGSGTVKLKITYATMTYEWCEPWGPNDAELIQMTDGNIQKEITIVVEDNKPVTPTPDKSKEETPSETPSEKPSETLSEKPSESPSEEQESESDNAYIVSSDNLIVKKEQLDEMLKENEKRDVIIKVSDDIEFTFKKGTMSSVDDRTEYDFTVETETNYQNKTEYGTQVTKDNFIMQVNYNYSGKLPGMASIRINVGADKVGKTLYYSKICDDGTFAYICSAVVDENGIITVNQDSCSDYILTTERIDDEANTDDVTDSDNVNTQIDNEKEPTSNVGGIIVAVIIIIAIIGVIVFVVLKRKNIIKI